MQQIKNNLRNRQCEFLQCYHRNRKIFWEEQNQFHIKSQICLHFLSILLFVCIFTLVVQILDFNHRTIHLNESAKTEFVTRSEIEGVVLNMLKKLRNYEDINVPFNESYAYEHNVKLKSLGVEKTR